MARHNDEASMKPFSEACEQNKYPILEVLRQYLVDQRELLEIGSGTGQHAVFFAAQFPMLQWHASDVSTYLPGIQMWCNEYTGTNLHGPYRLDVNQADWPLSQVDAIFSANTTHIMHWPDVEAMFAGIGRVLNPGGVFLLYGPFSYNGQHTSQSNADFDTFLKRRDPGSGIRDAGQLETLATQHGILLIDDVAMPVNNRTLVWRKGD